MASIEKLEGFAQGFDFPIFLDNRHQQYWVVFPQDKYHSAASETVPSAPPPAGMQAPVCVLDLGAHL